MGACLTTEDDGHEIKTISELKRDVSILIY